MIPYLSAPAPAKIPRMPEKSSNEPEIPHVLQGEIARLDQKFKITLDSTGQNNTKCIKLICCLGDKRLPSVPPVSVSIPGLFLFSLYQIYSKYFIFTLFYVSRGLSMVFARLFIGRAGI